MVGEIRESRTDPAVVIGSKNTGEREREREREGEEEEGWRMDQVIGSEKA